MVGRKNKEKDEITKNDCHNDHFLVLNFRKERIYSNDEDPSANESDFHPPQIWFEVIIQKSKCKFELFVVKRHSVSEQHNK